MGWWHADSLAQGPRCVLMARRQRLAVVPPDHGGPDGRSTDPVPRGDGPRHGKRTEVTTRCKGVSAVRTVGVCTCDVEASYRIVGNGP